MHPAPSSIAQTGGRPAGATTFVTQPHMPPLEEFIPYLETIWRNKWLTNAGPLHRELETALAERLGVAQIALVANGTIALTIALQALELEGEVITTPFSFVATSNALRALGLTPVFADIDPATCNLDPDAVEAAITPRTAAILPVHCFGHPCDAARLQAIADRHGIPILYDAAHAFGIRKGGRSILNDGTLSTLSFHATKVFNTFEGGAIVCQDRATKDRITSLRNFGFIDETSIGLNGLNGKMSEVHAAFGLLQLRHVDAAIARRRQISERYHEALRGVPGITLFPQAPDVEPNHGYFPILVGSGFPLGRDALCTVLQAQGISARRYFYPLICDMPAYRHVASAAAALPQARRIADRILCLPIYPDLREDALDTIIDTIRGAGDLAERGAA
jgi:dTDP-4-amino-4,6-dideoxygalactose transaminase